MDSCSSYKFVGLKDGGYCYCGNGYSTSAKVNDSECNKGYDGAGGSSKIAIYNNFQYSTEEVTSLVEEPAPDDESVTQDFPAPTPKPQDGHEPEPSGCWYCVNRDENSLEAVSKVAWTATTTKPDTHDGCSRSATIRVDVGCKQVEEDKKNKKRVRKAAWHLAEEVCVDCGFSENFSNSTSCRAQCTGKLNRLNRDTDTPDLNSICSCNDIKHIPPKYTKKLFGW